MLRLVCAVFFIVAAVATSPASAQTRPNVVVILSDDQSFGTVAGMPFMSKRTDWFDFGHAYANNTTCSPSRATLLTGLWSHHHGVEVSIRTPPPFEDRHTLATWLSGAGYKTAFFGKYHLGNPLGAAMESYIPPGWDHWIGWDDIDGREAYYNYTLNENGTSVAYGDAPEDYSTDVLTAMAVDYIRSAPPAYPFFLLLAYRGPHNGWIAAPRHIGTFPRTPFAKAANYNEADVTDKPAWWQARPLVRPDNTDGARRKELDTLLSVDEGTEQVVSVLRERGLLDNTMIIYMSDNGYSYGEHRYTGKLCAYEECSHIPMLMWYPWATPRRIDQLVTNADVAPTIAALAGVVPDSRMDGRSLLPLLNGEAWDRDAILLHSVPIDDGKVPNYWAIRTSQFKFIMTTETGELELYDLASDPSEIDNVVSSPRYSAVAEDLRSRLEHMRTAPPTYVGHP